MRRLIEYIDEGLLTSKEGPIITVDAGEFVRTCLEDALARGGSVKDIKIEYHNIPGPFKAQISVTNDLGYTGEKEGLILYRKDINQLNKIYRADPFRFDNIDNLTIVGFHLDKWPDWMQNTRFNCLYLNNTKSKTISDFNIDLSGVGNDIRNHFSFLALTRTRPSDTVPVFRNSRVYSKDCAVINLDYSDSLNMFGSGFVLDVPTTTKNIMSLGQIAAGFSKKAGVSGYIQVPKDKFSTDPKETDRSNRGILVDLIADYLRDWDNGRDILKKFDLIGMKIVPDKADTGMSKFNCIYKWDAREGNFTWTKFGFGR